MLEQFNGIKQLFRTVYQRHGSILGIDINPTAVYMVELGYDHKSLSLISYAHASFPASQADNGAPATQLVFKEFISQNNQSGKRTVTALPDQQAISKSLTLNSGLSLEEFEASIALEVRKSIPHKWSELSWDYQTLELNETNLEQNVLLVAAKTEHIHSHMELLHFAGLKPQAIELVSHAVERAAQYIFPRMTGNLQNKNVALIQISASSLLFFLVHQNKIVFMREVHFDCTYSDNKSFEALLAQQIQQVVEYTQATNPLFIQHILLMGELAVEGTNFAQRVELNLGIVTQLANPVVDFYDPNHHLSEDLLHIAPALWIAVGLALRVLDGKN
ncbi:MAG: pilus assembly protein PilM [Legionella sp.]|nr:pilus assembly protein PilM [Legionella sp.]